MTMPFRQQSLRRMTLNTVYGPVAGLVSMFRQQSLRRMTLNVETPIEGNGNGRFVSNRCAE